MTAGQCVSTITVLNTTSAMNGRVNWRTTARRGRGARMRLSNRGQPPLGVTELNVQIEQLEVEKELAVAEQAFERAAQLCHQAKTLKKQKESLLAAWLQRGAPSGIVDEELIKEIVTRMAPPLL